MSTTATTTPLLDRKIILLCGGTSDERRVAVASAQNVAALLPRSQIWFMDPLGKISEVTHMELGAHKNAFMQDFEPQNTGTQFMSLASGLKALDPAKVVFFLALHGGESEDGTIQKIFESQGFAYTGSDSVSSFNAFQKELAKSKVSLAGVTVAQGQVVRVPGQSPDQVRTQINAFFMKQGPLILKPNASGSSVGLLKVLKADQIDKVVKEVCSSPFAEYLMEELIQGRELTCGVMSDNKGKLIALPASEVKMEVGRDFDYEGKYLGKGSVEITPAEVPAQTMKRAQEVALRSHEALGCFGYSRTDMIWQPDTDRFVFLETNTLPGLTKASFIPQQLTAAREKMSDFVATQLFLAVQRQSKTRSI